ncbi:TetR/AcrR family transcriptional regulator [Nakamurella endophytica]|uniref:TetR family transcriptional regulator n=1 Tax=Nakamurella endophytica TaxID=1748367 RepID=A0A917SZJ1_9ACTN|nr:TetR-like C-terminal domain-containing protein [Nakamurella endophytica]GGM02805.1 TetR family transcriptional regulator [Nakamurella endophytica]
MLDGAEGPRARYRRQVLAEVRERAWQQVELAGASALSLKAIATDMGMTAPALYRYVAGRDELLTDLVLEAYGDLAETVEAAAGGSTGADASASGRGRGGGDGPDAAGVLRRAATALRDWAVRHPQRYLLLYGTPVPGYRAPAEATEFARRIFAPVLAAYGSSADPAGPADAGPALDRAVTFWTRLHGVLSLEVAGQFTGMAVDPAARYAAELDSVLPAD